MLSIISGTNRQNNQSIKVAKLYQNLALKQDTESQILDLSTLPPDFLFSASYGNKHPEFEKLVEQYVAKAQRFIFIIPEYNGSFPGALKSFVDCIEPKLWHHKKAALTGLSAGRAGNLRGLDHFTAVMHYLQVEVLSKKLKMSNFNQLLDDNKELTNPDNKQQITNHIKQFLNF